MRRSTLYVASSTCGRSSCEKRAKRSSSLMWATLTPWAPSPCPTSARCVGVGVVVSVGLKGVGGGWGTVLDLRMKSVRGCKLYFGCR